MEPPAPLPFVVLIFRKKIGFDALPHVVAATSAFLDSSVELPLAEACSFGSLELLDHIWESSNQFVDVDDEPEASRWCLRKLLRTNSHYQQFQFTKSLLEAVRLKELPMVRWLFAYFPGCTVRQSIVTEAAGFGLLEVLRFFREGESNMAADQDRDDDNLLVAEGRKVEWGYDDTVEAAENGHSRVVMWLFRHTDAIDRDGGGTMHAAVGNGDMPLMEWLVQRNRPKAWERLCPEVGINDAAANGHVAMLQWLLEYRGLVAGVLVQVAEKGQLDVVRWMIESDCAEVESDGEGGVDVTDLVAEASLAVHSAAANGHLEVAKYLCAIGDTQVNKLPRKQREQRLAKLARDIYREIGPDGQAESVSGKTMLLAAANGHLDVVQWIFEEFSVDSAVDLFGYRQRLEWERPMETIAMNAAAINGHLKIVQYLHEVAMLISTHNSRKRKREEAAENVASMEHLDILERVFGSKCHRKGTVGMSGPSCTPAAMDGAAANNHLDVVQWLHNNRAEGCSTDAMDLAGSNGHLEMVQWLHQHRTEGCSVRAMDLAASNGHLEMVQWLHQNRAEGCTAKAMNGAARGGHLAVVQWLHAHTCVGCTTETMDVAACNGHIEIVKWLHEHRSEGCTSAAMDGAARSGHLGVVKWLHTNRSEGCTTDAMDLAAEEGHLRVVQWLHEYRSEGCTTDAMYDAATNAHFEVVLFLHSALHEGIGGKSAVEGLRYGNFPEIYDWALASL
ncbi:hypothetical protein BBJ28_00019581 [Nothophytophthora sp. Chile5]|nr:hypothetical protein BBJ28_00019581 [Nothophytophthora sp. Chile5]